MASEFTAYGLWGPSWAGGARGRRRLDGAWTQRVEAQADVTPGPHLGPRRGAPRARGAVVSTGVTTVADRRPAIRVRMFGRGGNYGLDRWCKGGVSQPNMPIPSPFHERTGPLCVSHRWKDWGGYLAVCAYDACHQREYYAFRHATGVIDVTPLYKYEVRGARAAEFLSRVMVKNINKLKPNQVTYCCWCDDDGKVVDDGTVTRFADDHYRVTAAEPSLRWFTRLSRGYDVTIEDVSTQIAALALQGPTSRDVLKQCTDADLDKLKFFRMTQARLDDLDVTITRTGYTGDLGYEVWVDSGDAVKLWDAVMSAGRNYNIEPCGLDALDMTRIEAGFIMLHVDYFSSPHCVLESKKSSPYEIGLGWTVNLDREPFIGQAALRAEKERGSVWQTVGIELSWEEIEALYDSYGLPPGLPAAACRDSVPVYLDGKQVGQITSHTWSPVLKKSVGLATIKTPYAKVGAQLKVEHTVEYERRQVSGTIVETPFFNPVRKRKP